MLSVSVVLVLKPTHCFSEVTQKLIKLLVMAFRQCHIFFFISIPLVIISIQTTERQHLAQSKVGMSQAYHQDMCFSLCLRLHIYNRKPFFS